MQRVEVLDDMMGRLYLGDLSSFEGYSAKTLAVRIHRCDRCGIVLDRDHNAALNVLQRGRAMLCLPKLRELPMGHGEFTPLEIECSRSLKQEEAPEFIQG